MGQFNGGKNDHVRGGGLFYGRENGHVTEVTSLKEGEMVMLRRLSL